MSPKAPKPEKVQLLTPDIAAERLAAFRSCFPEAVSEGKVDFDKLRTALGDEVDSRPERYSFTWAGKRDCIRLLQTPSKATLVPCPEESINFDQTDNIFIEGENLETLKLLYKSYFGRVKMIYIDPPYNTGNDFIYPDNFADPLDTYLRLTGQKDAKGNVLTSNPETSGRYHSAWLSMMYPRLFLARQLLREDGVIFVSIDDHEVHNLHLLMNEIFGEENFLESIIWKKRSTPPNDKVLGANHDYILVFARNQEVVKLHLRRRSGEQVERYKNPDNHPKGPWTPGDLMANVKGGRYVASLHFPIKNPNTGEEHYPGDGGNWRFNSDRIRKLLADNEIFFGQDGKGRPKLKRFLADVKEGITWPTIWDFAPLNTQGSEEMTEILGNMTIFENPKPSGLLVELGRLGSGPGDIILDFFAGSGSTAHAILDLNRQDGVNRKFVLVQLPEPCVPESAAYKAGFKTIADIGKERIRRVIAKMKEEDAGKLALREREAPEDLGFRVFKMAGSNFKQWTGVEEKDAESYAQKMEMFSDSMTKGTDPLYAIWEVAIKEGYDLNAHIATVAKVVGNAFYCVSDPDREQSFLICLDSKIKKDTLKTLNLKKDEIFVCRDRALDDDAAANLALQCRLKTV